MNSFAQKSRHGRKHGFTLVEMLVAVSILALIMILAAQMIGATSKIWKNTTSKIEAFQNARDGFQLMTDELRQATVNTYWDYFDNTGRSAHYSTLNPFIPAAYGRQSDLHFQCGTSLLGVQASKTQAAFFQAPLGYVANPGLYGGLQNLLNAVGFFLQVSDGTNVINVPPPFMGATPIYRYRLMQFIQPSELNTVFNYSLTQGTAAATWFSTPLANTTGRSTTVRVVANNIVALIFWPKATDSAADALSTDYSYNSRLGLTSGTAVPPATWVPGGANPGIGQQPLQMNQMPPILRVAMVAIDEPSAKILPGVAANGVSSYITAAYNQSNPASGTALFKNPQFMDSDLLYFQYGPAGLASIHPHINFRVFSTTVVVKSARYSTQ
jgi:uncharacterized protein (TIGR02599 family)